VDSGATRLCSTSGGDQQLATLLYARSRRLIRDRASNTSKQMLEDGGQRHERTATVCVAVVQATRGVETWLERCNT
jgi:hypothetical protein